VSPAPGCIKKSAPACMERRLKVRYPIEVNVCYRAVERRQCVSGTGQTTDLSSGGVRVVTPQEHHLLTGTKVEIKMKWISLLHGTVPLNLVAIARVARCGKSSFAAKFERYEFRIAGRPLPCSLVKSA
jgi:hypothetical protein